jgi:transposase InsO family protein
MKYLRSDNGLEYRDTAFLKFCKIEGITHYFTVEGTPQQNGVVERLNKTLLEKARCMKLNTGLPKSLWVESINYACFVTNRSPSIAIDFKVSEEIWSGKLADYSVLRIFGCPTYVHMQSGERLKLDSKSRKCICHGLESSVKGCRL